jgi:hypothetical protein
MAGDPGDLAGGLQHLRAAGGGCHPAHSKDSPTPGQILGEGANPGYIFIRHVRSVLRLMAKIEARTPIQGILAFFATRLISALLEGRKRDK